MRLIGLVVIAACGRIGFDPLGSVLDPTAQAHSVAAGARFSCAIREDTTVWCWGDNAGGQIGDATGKPHATPAQIPGLDHVVAIDGGEEAACALRDDGTVWCWGGNTFAELGSLDGIDHPQPIEVDLPSAATQISFGSFFACARLDDGTAWCWGRNDQGQIANTMGYPPMNPPTLQLDDVVQIAAGDVHTCAIRGDGSVWCWGYTADGRLGRAGDLYPAPIPSFTAVSLSAYDGTCAILAGGRVSCWGVDQYGELGDGQTGTDVFTPNPPSSASGVVAMAIGEDHTCALLGDEVVCVGHNDVGQLGVGDQLDRTSISSMSIAGVVSLAVKGEHACAAKADGSIWCWGRSSDGELGTGSIGAFAPQHVDLGASVDEVSAGGDQTCAVAGGDVYCWGDDAPIMSLGLTNVAGIRTGATHACGWFGDGTAWCIGSDSAGQIGDGGAYAVTVPYVLPTLSGVTQVAAGDEISCAITGTTAACWGRGIDGALGNGTNGQATMPTAMSVTYAGIPMDLVAGGHDTCMTTTSGNAYCAGANNEGQIGDNTIDDKLVMTQVVGVVNAAIIATSGDHACVRMNGGLAAVQCWGDGESGQLGDGNFQSVITAVDVQGLGTAGFGGIATGYQLTCASAGPGVQCWGDNTYGQIGDGTTIDRGVPASVAGIGAITGITAGDQHVCAIAGAQLYCWGDNAHGQQGDGTFSRALAPVEVSFP